MAEKKDQALQLLRKGVSPADVARRLDIPAATVRTWKNRLKKKNETAKSVSGVSDETKHGVGKKIASSLAVAVEENTELTQVEKDFCLHYSYRPNASRAYRLAAPGCAISTARAEGCRLLAKHNIQAEIARLNHIRREQMLMKVAAEESQIFQMYWDIAFSDLSEFVNWGKENGRSFVQFEDSDTVDGTLISEVKQGRDGVSVKLADRMAALKWLADYFEMNPTDKHRKAYDERRLAIEEAKIGALQQDSGDIVFKIVAATPDEALDEDSE